MTTAPSPEEKQARELEDKARQHLRDKEYDAALANYASAMEIYANMGWQGQVGILKKEVERIQTMKKFFSDQVPAEMGKTDREKGAELEKKANALVKKAQDAALEKKNTESLDLYNQALQIFDGLHFDYQNQKIRWEIQKLQRLIESRGNITPQPSIADERMVRIEREQELQEQKRKLQETIRERERQDELKRAKTVATLKEPPRPPTETSSPLKEPANPPKQLSPAMGESSDLITDKRKAQMERMRALEEKRKRENDIQAKAFATMDQAKQFLKQNKFTEAQNSYNESIKYLEQINWTNQIDTVKREIAELKTREEDFRKRSGLDKARKDAQERDFQEKLKTLQHKKDLEEQERAETRRKMDEKRKQAEEEHYRLREEDIIKEKERVARLEEEKRKAKSPEYVKKVQLAEMTLTKAQKFETAGKNDLAVDRYRYLVELYKELEYSPEKIDKINEKIKILKPN